MGDSQYDTAHVGADEGKSKIAQCKVEDCSKAMTQQPLGIVGKLNIAFFALAIGGLLFYVIAANTLAAQAWRIADAQDQLTTILNERNDIIAQQSQLDDRARLSELAVSVGMIPAGAVVYLMQEGPMAAR